jgi:hypothetical protein
MFSGVVRKVTWSDYEECRYFATPTLKLQKIHARMLADKDELDMSAVSTLTRHGKHSRDN